MYSRIFINLQTALFQSRRSHNDGNLAQKPGISTCFVLEIDEVPMVPIDCVK